VVEVYLMQQYITQEDLKLINAALEKGEVVKIRHTEKGGTKITRELSETILAKRPRDN